MWWAKYDSGLPEGVFIRYWYTFWREEMIAARFGSNNTTAWEFEGTLVFPVTIYLDKTAQSSVLFRFFFFLIFHFSSHMYRLLVLSFFLIVGFAIPAFWQTTRPSLYPGKYLVLQASIKTYLLLIGNKLRIESCIFYLNISSRRLWPYSHHRY